MPRQAWEIKLRYCSKSPRRSPHFRLSLPATTLLYPIKSHFNHREACISNSPKGLQLVGVSSLEYPGELCGDGRHLNVPSPAATGAPCVWQSPWNHPQYQKRVRDGNFLTGPQHKEQNNNSFFSSTQKTKFDFTCLQIRAKRFYLCLSPRSEGASHASRLAQSPEVWLSGRKHIL